MRVVIRPLREADLDAAEDIYRHAFRAFLNIPDSQIGDFDHVRNRYYGDPSAAFGAEIDGVLVGSNFLSRWGSLCVMGPTTVRPVGWTGRAGRMLVDAAFELADRWGIHRVAGYTFSHSGRHAEFFLGADIQMRHLVAHLGRTIRRPSGTVRFDLFSRMKEADRVAALDACRALTGGLYPGMDLELEIRKVQQQSIGDTVLLREGGQLLGFAVCHCGPGSEAGSKTCFVKFGAVHPSPFASESFARLLTACEDFAALRAMPLLKLGINTVHRAAYQQVLGRGYSLMTLGVALHRGGDPLYKDPAFFVIDDWR